MKATGQTMDGADFEDPSLLSLVPQPGEEMMVRNNMVANLPLLFAGGYPTTLGKITETQLEQFIPFMVQCSLGCIQINGEFEYSEPEWWPDYVPFVIPLRRPASIAPGDWHKKLREIVVICYSFHKVVYLLRFCDDLSVYTKESLRFINNKNTTTSMLERVTNKLLVTFRNENMVSFDGIGKWVIMKLLHIFHISNRNRKSSGLKYFRLTNRTFGHADMWL